MTFGPVSANTNTDCPRNLFPTHTHTHTKFAVQWCLESLISTKIEVSQVCFIGGWVADKIGTLLRKDDINLSHLTSLSRVGAVKSPGSFYLDVWPIAINVSYQHWYILDLLCGQSIITYGINCRGSSIMTKDKERINRLMRKSEKNCKKNTYTNRLPVWRPRCEQS